MANPSNPYPPEPGKGLRDPFANRRDRQVGKTTGVGVKARPGGLGQKTGRFHSKQTPLLPKTKKPGVTPAPKTPKPKAPTVQPFLTPTQLRALQAYDAKFGARVGSDQRRIRDTTYNTNQALAGAAQQHTLGTSQANEQMAARGLFQSSIRDGDLNDLDATYAMRQNILNTSLHNVMLDTTGDINNAIHDYGSEHNFFNELATQNAAAQPPALGGAGAPGTKPAGTPNGGGGANGGRDTPNGMQTGVGVAFPKPVPTHYTVGGPTTAAGWPNLPWMRGIGSSPGNANGGRQSPFGRGWGRGAGTTGARA